MLHCWGLSRARGLQPCRGAGGQSRGRVPALPSQARCPEQGGGGGWLGGEGRGQGTRCVGVPGAFHLSSRPQNGLRQAKARSVPAMEPRPWCNSRVMEWLFPKTEQSHCTSPHVLSALVCPRGNCLVAAFQGVWDCNYLGALITRQASINQSSSSTRAQRQLTQGEKAGLCRDTAAGLTLLHAGGLQTEFLPGQSTGRDGAPQD